MDAWIQFWKIVLFAGVGAFSVLALWVIIAGFGDIKRMFADLRQQRECNSDREPR
jgi:hypothetical protein